MVRILIADSQYLVREGLKAILATQPDFQVVGEVEDAKQLRATAESIRPDVIILDYHPESPFPESWWEDTLGLIQHYPFLIISQDHNRSRITQILERGVNAFLTKYCDQEEIISAIRAAVRSEKYFCTKILDILIESVREDVRDTCAPSNLTLREAEIVRLIASGTKTRDIADKLHLSLHTVNTHKKNIFKKLNINSGQELVLYALRTGLVTSETQSTSLRAVRSAQ